MSDDSGQRSEYISGKLPIPDLKRRLELLIATGRNPRITSVADVDAQLKLVGERAMRRYYRPDLKIKGIPGDLLPDFLALFRLRQDELLLPIEDFERLLQSTSSHGRPPIGWYGSEAKFPAARVVRTSRGDISFAWPSLGLAVVFVSERESAPIQAPDVTLLNLRVRERSAARVLLQREFRIEVNVPAGRRSGVMGLMEGSQLSCFLKPNELLPTGRPLRIPSEGLPFYLDEVGRHSLWILLFGVARYNSADIEALDCEDTRARRDAAERIYNDAPTKLQEPVVVLRADFDVVT